MNPSRVPNKDAATVNRGIFESFRCCRWDLALVPAWDSAADVANAVVASSVVTIIVGATVLTIACVITLNEAIPKLLRRGILVVV